MKDKVICPYCNKTAKLTTGDKIYGGNKWKHHKFWLCEPCDAYVGCHKKHSKYSPKGITPFGTLANEELRGLRRAAHKLLLSQIGDKRKFPKTWYKRKGIAYKFLAHNLGLEKYNCHMGSFDKSMCIKTIRLLETKQIFIL